jgi:two-component sensor histidine kinase
VSLNPVDGSKYELVVRDNGIGLPGDLDLKETGSLGLSLVSILAEQLGGDLRIKNEKGAVFSLIFSEYLETGTEVH